MATRPYGIGPYGTGPYERYAAGPVTYVVGGASGITFDAWATRPQLTFTAAALSGIVFSLSADLEFSWRGWAPCEDGAWQPAGPCEPGTWTTPPACGTGTWTETRLEVLP